MRRTCETCREEYRHESSTATVYDTGERVLIVGCSTPCLVARILEHFEEYQP